MSQTCPSYSAGFTGQRYIHGSSDGGIYVNEAPALRAPCNGVVYAWHYCYYNEGSATNLEVAFGAYSFMSFAGGDDGDDEDSDSGGSVRGTYHLRSGSYYLHHLDRRKNTFTCDTITLNRSQHFQIYEGDRVGACLREYSGVEPLEILAEDSSRQYKVVKWGSNSGHCRWRDMATSSLERASHAFVLHLYVDISKFENQIQNQCIIIISFFPDINECDLHEDNCSHSLATCIDVIGGDGSFECRCNEGYTGDGVTCTGKYI